MIQSLFKMNLNVFDCPPNEFTTDGDAGGKRYFRRARRLLYEIYFLLLRSCLSVTAFVVFAPGAGPQRTLLFLSLIYMLA
jgi:hypothetical protein